MQKYYHRRNFHQQLFSDILNKNGKTTDTEKDESEKANKVAHILRSRESEHTIRKVSFYFYVLRDNNLCYTNALYFLCY